MSLTFGFDLSHYEPNIDWQKVKSAGVKFAYAKASQGSVQDDLFDTHRLGAKGVGVPFGGYHFYDPRFSTVDPKFQAEFFWEIMRDDPGQLPLVIDLEKYTEGPWAGWKNWYVFLERLKQLAPEKEIMIYTGYYFWKDAGPAWWDLPRHAYFSQYSLWLAYYPDGANPPTTTPEAQGLIPQTWKSKGWTLWQTSDHLTLDGVFDPLGRLTGVDYDYFNGDEAAFRARFKLGDGETAPIPTTEVIMNYRYKLTPATSSGSSIRKTHEVADNRIGVLSFGKSAYGDELWGDGVQEQWLRVLEVDGVAVTQESWISVRHEGTVISTLTQIAPDPIEDAVTVDVRAEINGAVYEASGIRLGKVA